MADVARAHDADVPDATDAAHAIVTADASNAADVANATDADQVQDSSIVFLHCRRFLSFSRGNEKNPRHHFIFN